MELVDLPVPQPKANEAVVKLSASGVNFIDVYFREGRYKAVPPFVLGGTLLFMFGMIGAVGIGILADSLRSQRDLLLFAASFGLSTAVNFAPPSMLELAPQSLRILAGDGIVIGTVVAVMLNLILPAKEPSAT